MSWLLTLRRGVATKAVLTVALVVCFPLSAQAAEWSAEPSVTMGETYNDNIHLTTVPHNAVRATRFSPSMKLSGKLETLEISGSAGVTVNRYSGEKGLDTTDRVFNLSSLYNTERDNFGLTISHMLDSTLASELAQTGYVSSRKQRRYNTLSPSWTRALTERLKFTADYQYADAKYETDPNLTDYTDQQVRGILEYMWSEQDQLFLVVSSDKVRYASTAGRRSAIPVPFPYNLIYGVNYLYGGQFSLTDRDTKTKNIMVGMSRNFSESLSGTLKIGRRSTVSSSVTTCNGINDSCTWRDNPDGADPLITLRQATSSSGSTFEASVNKQFETLKIGGQASRELNASGSGLVETSNVGISMSDRLSETLSGTLNVSVYSTKYQGDVPTNNDSRYLLIAPGLSWRMSEWWLMDAGYNYARQKYVNSLSAATANSIYVNFTYNWPKISVSR
jgi:hypothetical protein